MKNIFVLSMIALLSGCATSAKVGNMVAKNTDNHYSTSGPLANAVAVKRVSGGQRIHPLLIFNVESKNFSEALKASLKRQGLLCNSADKCRYQLIAKINNFSIPAFTIDAKVTSNIHYHVIDQQQNTSENFNISALFVANWLDYPHAPTRPLKGAEGSIKKNIGQFINRLKDQYPQP